MKAVLAKAYAGSGQLVYGEHQLPDISKDQVLIEVKYAGVNFPDTLIIRGKYQFKPELPFSPGGEVSGIIKSVGTNIHHLKVGDRVVSGTSWGGFAEEAIGLGTNTFKLPDDVSFKEAASFFTTYGTVCHALKDRGDLKKGERLVVLGASGGVGTAAIQLGKYFGAEVVACASSSEKLDFCKTLGADHLINYIDSDLKAELKALGGADVIFDPVGDQFSEPAFRSINPFGRHLVVGFAAGKVPAIAWNLPLLKSASIVGVFFGGFWRKFPESNAKNIDLLLDLLSKGEIKAGISQTFPLADASLALQLIESRQAKGKLVIKVND